MHLDLLALDSARVGREIRKQVDFRNAEIVDEIVHGDPAEIDPALVLRGEVAPVALGSFRIGSRIAVLRLVLAVDHQGYVEQKRHFRRQILLSEHEGLERMEQVLHREPREQTMGAAVGRVQKIIEPRVDPGLEVFPSPFGIDVRRPGDRERMHAILVLENMRGIEAVLAA